MIRNADTRILSLEEVFPIHDAMYFDPKFYSEVQSFKIGSVSF